MLFRSANFIILGYRGTNEIEGMVLKLTPNEEKEANAEAFSKMNKLRLLKISKLRLFNGLSNLSNELRLLEWHEYPLKSLPRSFQLGKLVELIMHRSRIRQLPEEFWVRFPLLQFFLLGFLFL